jgi:hypothetical protein
VIKVGSTDVTIDTQINHNVLDHGVGNQCCSGFEVKGGKDEELKSLKEVDNKKVVLAKPPLIIRKE